MTGDAGPVTVFGGSGFLGRHVVRRLAQRGARVRVAVRYTDRTAFLKIPGPPGQIDVTEADIRDPGQVRAAVADAAAVVNLTGILRETGTQDFRNIHVLGAGRVAAAAAARGARLVHVSAIGADPEAEPGYARSKGLGEQAVRKELPGAVILRPSVIFGEEDNFSRRFARMPFLPLPGDGSARLQPVYVDDVARAVALATAMPGLAGRTLELGGPDILSWRELFRMISGMTGKRVPVVPVPADLMIALGGLLERLWLGCILTRDQARMALEDNIVSPGVAGFDALGIAPVSFGATAQRFLGRGRPLRDETPGIREG